MGRIRGRDTRPELAVRSALHRAGLRFRVHDKTLPGRPDIVLKSRRAVVFVHGCFWHRHPACKFAYTPRSRVDFWATKFTGNIERDRRNDEELQQMGWRVIVVWECESGRADKLVDLARSITSLPVLLPAQQRHLADKGRLSRR